MKTGAFWMRAVAVLAAAAAAGLDGGWDCAGGAGRHRDRPVVPGVTQATGSTVSCAAAGSCVAAGSAGATAASREAFTVTESGGTWGSAVPVPGVAALDTGKDATVRSVACPVGG